MKTWIVNTAIAVTFALSLTACGGSSATRGDESGGAGTTTGTTDSGLKGERSNDSTQVAAQRPGKLRVLFEYDSSAIDSESRRLIEQHAAYLEANPGVKINLTGHADERGTREYNLALGERRGESVERMLQVLGVSTDRNNFV